MDPMQFQQFMKAFQDVTKALVDKGKGTASSSSSGSSSTSGAKISVKIPTYKGEPNENVVVWLRQVKNIFHAQGILDEGNMVHYAATGLEDAALHWFVNKVKDATTGPAFNTWAEFCKSLKESFQPPNYQHYLRTQLKNLRQTSTVQEYGMRFRNIIEQIDNMNELDKVSYFVDGLKGATRMEIAYQSPENFEEAWKLAIRFDTAMFGLGKPKTNYQGFSTFQGGKHQQSSRKGNYNNHSTPMELDYAGTSNYNSYKGNSKGNWKQPMKGNCHNCGKPGHYKRDCPNNNNNQQQQQLQQLQREGQGQ